MMPETYLEQHTVEGISIRHQARSHLRVQAILCRIGTTASEYCSNNQTPGTIGVINAFHSRVFPFQDISILGHFPIRLLFRRVISYFHMPLILFRQVISYSSHATAI